jgi:hypothetical protein
MRLERHVGGLGRARQRSYLLARGWAETGEGWRHARAGETAWARPRALHHQLTHDLCAALARWDWRVEGYSSRGYAQLLDGRTGARRSLPAALRVEARRQGQRVADFTYALFLNAVVDGRP